MEPICRYFKTKSPIFFAPDKGNQQQLNSSLSNINLLLEELCIGIFDKLNYLDQNNFGLSCKKFYFLSKNASMWLSLHERMNNFILLHSQVCPVVSFLNVNNGEPIFGIKDIVCAALKESKPEALLAKCMFFFNNNSVYTKRDYLRACDVILSIIQNEDNISVNTALKIKIDLLHAELLMILRVECRVAGVDDEQDFFSIKDLLEGIYNNETASDEEKTWAMCLAVQLYYYTHNVLVYGTLIEKDIFINSFEEALDNLQDIIHNPSSSTSCKSIAKLYKALIGHCGIVVGVINEFEVYELFKECMDSIKTPCLPPAYQAKCILQMALMKYHIDLPKGKKEGNEELFKEFNKVIQNECAFPQDKTIAMLYQAIMRYRDLSDSITYAEAEQLLDKIIEDKLSSSKNVATARMYKASMNFAKQTQSMTGNEIYDVFDKFVASNDIQIKHEDKSLARINMGLMLVQKLVQRINPLQTAFVLFYDLILLSNSNDIYSAAVLSQYITIAEEQLEFIKLSSNWKKFRSAIL